jgi:hypothetical protein
MPRSYSRKITPQAIGAYGEKIVEAELLRRGWIASNVNANIKNVADFDIFALKDGRSVHLRVKTCGPEFDAFQFSGRLIREQPKNIGNLDFAVLVRMGATRQDDHFYIIPTRALLETIHSYRQAYLDRAKRDGGIRKDVGHWTLHLAELRSGEDRVNYGLATKWAAYRDKWDLLEG